ncbi:MAG TPA: YihA family ribosome biogenesis GTP-binding protein [Firmicutes bacterium]|nr:YihA family ribosome biogenesis GTP-binding protein [Bacillota bacterium]
MKIESVELTNIAVRTNQYPTGDDPEFLLVGRSNVGKSSFINTIINRKNFAHTSSTPGKTQTLNFYFVNSSFYLVDVPGYGYAKVDRPTQKKFGLMIEDYLKTRYTLKRVFLLIDFRIKPTEDDILMYNYLKYYKIPVTIVATKFDKASMKMRDKQIKVIEESIKLEDGDDIVYFSSVNKKGKDEIYKILASYLDE